MSKKKSEFISGIKLNWWQAGVFKTAAVLFGMILGVYFFETVALLLHWLWIVFLVSSSYIVYLWYQQKS